MRSISCAFVLCFSCLIGCSSSGGGGGFATDAGAGTGGTGNTSATGGSGGSVANGQTQSCARYVSCTAATNAATLGTVLDTYGPNGACWDQGAAVRAACDGACVEGLAQANAAYPDEPECGECKSAADCKDPTKAFCLETTHRCSSNSDPDLPLCLGALGCTGSFDGFVCAEEKCPTEYAACFGPGGKCAAMTSCLESCGGCKEPGCIESCAEAGIPQTCIDECLDPSLGPLYDCMQSNFCGC